MRRRSSHLLLGMLIVLAIATRARAAEPSRITLALRMAADGVEWVTATVVDARGTPVAEAPITFKARTAFGWLRLAEASTDASGRAQMPLPSTFRPTAIAAEAVEGEEIRTVLQLGEKMANEASVRPGRNLLRRLSPQPGFISPYPVPMQVALLAVILGGIWTTYAYVVWLLWRIRRAR